MKQVLIVAGSYIILIIIFCAISEWLHTSLDRLVQFNILWWVMFIAYKITTQPSTTDYN